MACWLAESFAPRRLDKLFITHLHSDHVTGLASLLLNTWIFGREEPMKIFGPPGTRNLTQKILEAYSVDIEDRLKALDPAPPKGCKVTVQEITGDGTVYDDGILQIDAFFHPMAIWIIWGIGSRLLTKLSSGPGTAV